jgi:nucleoside-diphosphate-sugar epimerase
MRILVTGAAGFLGTVLICVLTTRSPDEDITAIDVVPGHIHRATGRVAWISGSLDDPGILDQAGLDKVDVVFHLASIPGGLAERQRALGRRINLDATLGLFDRLASSGKRPRVVYASSVAVYGEMNGSPIGSDSPIRPTSTYGAHKRMAEIALADFSRRGELSGIAIRFPALIARPGPASGFGSAFMSELPRAYAAGEPYVCPVSPHATAWWMSARCAVRNLVWAASIDASGDIQLPALRLSVAEVVDALERSFGPERRALITFEPDARTEALFGRYPGLSTAREEALGLRHDGTTERLLKKALAT